MKKKFELTFIDPMKKTMINKEIYYYNIFYSSTDLIIENHFSFFDALVSII